MKETITAFVVIIITLAVCLSIGGIEHKKYKLRQEIRSKSIEVCKLLDGEMITSGNRVSCFVPNELPRFMYTY